MFCRAKIGVVLALTGALAGWAAPLNPDQKNPAPAHGAQVAQTVVKPTKCHTSFSPNSHGGAIEIQKNGFGADLPSLNPPAGEVVKK